jgi:type IV pilus assembly protein PilB
MFHIGVRVRGRSLSVYHPPWGQPIELILLEIQLTLSQELAKRVHSSPRQGLGLRSLLVFESHWTAYMAKDLAIGDLLIQIGLVDAGGLARAREAQEKSHCSLGKALASLGLVDEEAVSTALAEKLHLELLAPDMLEVSTGLAAILPADFCRKRVVAPLSVQGKVLRLALAYPMDYSTIQDVEFRSGKRVVPVIASETSILTMLKQIYPAEDQSQLNKLAAEVPEGEVEPLDESEFEVVDPDKLAQDTQMPPVVRLVNLILSGAAKEGASDIHMEPKENHLQVRYRVDGLLRDVIRVPKNQQEPTISRVKIISGMDITDRRRPQDGRSRFRFEGKRIDLRVSTLPTHFGEKVVIRLLDSKRAEITMEQLGLSAENLRLLQSMLSRPQGMILVTGPTGSGKSSTLYTALGWVKSSTKNIITVEDPIEYQLEGVNQVQINPKAGVTFAAGLRSILRQDPNVIMVGEIRDQETAGIALEAAQTGHLLLSTLHTNDAPATISRLLDLGIEPFLISSAVIGILAQRLVRKPCPACTIPHAPTPELIEKAGGLSQMPPDGKWVTGKGCDACRQSGFKGRLGIHELLPVNDEIRDLISRRAPEHEIRKAARGAGMRTLLEDGISKAAQGLTSLEEVLRLATSDGGGAQKAHAGQMAPVESTAHVSMETETDDTLPATSAESTSFSLSGEKERVLVVEDSRTIANVVKYFLEIEGFDVLLAKDGKTGLEMAKREHPHVIVTDYNMPGMDGLSMVKELRADPATRSVAVLMLTSEEGVDKETQALAAGVDDYILKPVEPRRLAARVKSVLARSKERQVAVSR